MMGFPKLVEPIALDGATVHAALMFEEHWLYHSLYINVVSLLAV